MRSHAILPIALLLTGVFASASAVELPAQKPGVLEMSMKNAKIPGGSRSFSMCEDAAFIAAAKASADAHKKDCSKYDLHKQGDTWSADTECTFSGMHIVTHSMTTIHGDDAYHTEITSSTDSPGLGKTNDVMTVDNKYLGACKPGQKAGVPIVGR